MTHYHGATLKGSVIISIVGNGGYWITTYLCPCGQVFDRVTRIQERTPEGWPLRSVTRQYARP